MYALTSPVYLLEHGERKAPINMLPRSKAPKTQQDEH